MAVCLHLHLFRDLRSTTRSSDGGRAEQPELDSAADLYGAVYRPVREKGFSKPYILALGIVIFAVLLYTSLWFFHLPSGLATVLMFGITVLFGLGTGGVYYIPWTVYTFLADVDEIYTDAGGKDLCRRHDLLRKNSALDCGVLDGAILSFYGFQSKAHSQPESAR